MIELGCLSLSNTDRIIETRKKIGRLAENLGFDEIHSTRLEAITHEICRIGCHAGKKMEIEVGLILDDSLPVLALNFRSQEKIEKAPGLSNFFDVVHIEKRGGDATHLSVRRFLPKSGRCLSPDFIEEQKAILGVISRDALMDILNEKNEELESRALEMSKLSQAVIHSPASIVITDISGRIEYVNPKFVEMTGYRSDEALGQTPRILKSGTHAREFYEAMWKTILSGQDWHGELCNLRKDGSFFWESTSISPVRDGEGKVQYFVAVKEDVTDRKRMEEEILALSITDQLTGLYNRRGFLSLAEQQLKLSERNKNEMLLFFADLDLLKWINDVLGHEEGDKALIEAANILKKTFRKSDIIARLGGDEFAILAVDITGGNSKVFTSRLQTMIDKRNNQENRKYKLSISMGCAYYDPENPCSIDDLIAHADKLMYEQKQNRKGLLLQGASPSSGNPHLKAEPIIV